jgi:L-ascorbate metabolism protein UlaG (beta-lactamase superfamily)
VRRQLDSEAGLGGTASGWSRCAARSRSTAGGGATRSDSARSLGSHSPGRPSPGNSTTAASTPHASSASGHRTSNFEIVRNGFTEVRQRTPDLRRAKSPATVEFVSGETTARAGELARLHRRVPVRRYRSLLGHWLARWFRAPRPAQLEPVPAIRAGELALTFGGHATLIARYHDLAIAFDPMLARWLGGVRRAVEPGLAPGDFSDVGLILISHRHADHLHVPTLRRMPRSATIVVPAGAAGWVSSLGFTRVVELQVGADLALRGVQVTAAATSHGDAELARGLSYVVRGDGPSVYLCGDSGYFSGFADVGARFAPDLAVLPIGGFLPTSFRSRHMSPLDALYAFEDLRARTLVPIHHGAFALSYEELDEPARWLAELATARAIRDHVQLMAAGQSQKFVASARAIRDHVQLMAAGQSQKLVASELAREGEAGRASAPHADTGEAGHASAPPPRADTGEAGEGSRGRAASEPAAREPVLG